MAQKGVRASLEPIAKRMYAEGRNLADIGAELGVSATSLSIWKRETAPTQGDGPDEWDRSRRQQRNNIQRLKDIFERELNAVEESLAGSINPASIDALSKLGALVKRWDEVERAAEASTGITIDRPALFLEYLEWIAKQLQQNDPEGLKALARNFDYLIITFKAEYARTS